MTRHLSNLSLLFCVPEVPEYSFDGHSHVHYQLALPLPARRTWIQVMVRTRKHSSILFNLISKEQTEYLRLEVSLLRDYTYGYTEMADRGRQIYLYSPWFSPQIEL